jgi:hypothetical protein
METATLLLRGGGRSATPLFPVSGVFRGTSRVECRACALDLTEGNDPVMEPFAKLQEVESVFCAMLSQVTDKVEALATLQGCSLSVIPVIDEATDLAALVVKTD